MTTPHRARRRPLVGLIVLALAAPTAYAQWSEAKSAYEAGEHARARTLLLPLAQQGDARALRLLGHQYAVGAGGAQDTVKARECYRVAAEAGDVEAQNAFAHVLLNAIGGEADCEAAVGWFERAAAAGSEIAQYNLGFIYEEGADCVASDRAQALDRYGRSAMQGYPSAQYKLSLMLAPSRPEQSLFWLRSAAERGFLLAQGDLAARYAAGHGVEQNWRRAVLWYERAAAQGSVEALVRLGHIHRRGDGVPRDGAEALRWFGRAADLGSGSAMLSVALMYDAGEGIEQDHAQAIRWYQAAAERGVAQACNNLAGKIAGGAGVEPDRTRGLAWAILAVATAERHGDPMSDGYRANYETLAQALPPEAIAHARQIAAQFAAEHWATPTSEP